MTTYYDQLQRPHEKSDGEPVVWRPSAYGILENDKKEWFFVRPTWTKRLDLPGGGVEQEELIRDGLAREFYEETGYRVEAEAQPVYLGERNFVHKHLGFCNAIIVIYRVRLLNEQRDAHVVNTFDDGFEIEDSFWIDPSTLIEDDVTPVIWPYIDSLRSSL